MTKPPVTAALDLMKTRRVVVDISATLPVRPADSQRGRAMDRLANARVSAAATDVAAHRLIDIRVGRFRVLFQQRRGGHDLAGLAVAALGHVDLDPRLLHRMTA